MMKSKQKEIRWGVIGAGDVCKVKSAPAMNKIPHSRLVAVMRRDGEKAREYASIHNVPRWYDDADKLLSDPEVNAVYIATPPHVHSELTRKAAEAGKPVYVEKPMARSYRECLEMIESCEQAGVPLFVAYYRRMLPNYRKIMELVDGGVIGEVRSVDIRMSKPINPDFDRDPANWRVDPDSAGGGYFYDLASHQLDFLDYLLGPISEAKGFASNQTGYYRAEDIVTGSFRFENGVLGTGNWCFTTAKSATTDLTTITGSRGVITYPTFSGYYIDLKTDADPETGQAEAEIRHLRSSNETQTEKSDGNSSNAIRFHFDIPEHIQQPLIETIVKELLEYFDGQPEGRPDRKTKVQAKEQPDEQPKGQTEGQSEGQAKGQPEGQAKKRPEGQTEEQPDRQHGENGPSQSRSSDTQTVTRCPSTGITAARTNRVMETLTTRS